MLAYNSDPALKAALLDQIRKHREMDQIVQGTYGNGTGEHWRGCAIGCSLRSLDIVRGNDVAESYLAHSRYPAELGIPLELAFLEDRIFENLPIQIAREWPERFAAAIVPGADLSGVWSRFALWSLTDPLHGVQRYADDIGRGAVLAVAALFQRRLDGDEPAVKEWRAAVATAYAAGYAYASEAGYAGTTAYAAAATTYAAAAYARAATAYARAAYARAAAAYARATAAARYAAASSAEPMADKLVELLGNAR